MGKKIRLTEEQFKQCLLEWGYHKKPEENIYSMDDKIELMDDSLANGKNTNKHNFGITRNGKQYWISRSATISLYTFCRNKNGEWCALAIKRGDNSKWTCVRGYLDYNETLSHAAIRECFEETGVKIPENKLMQCGINDSKDDIVVYFYCILDGIIDNYPISLANCEPGEILDCQWINFNDFGNKLYNWWGRQGEFMLDFGKRVTRKMSNLENNEQYNQVIIDLQKLIKSGILSTNEYEKIINIIKN